MLTRSHFITGGATALAAAAVVYTIKGRVDLGVINDAAAAVRDYIRPQGGAEIAAGVALYALGLTLPDCDTKKSFIGRVIHIPVRHRTWTHTVWFAALWMALAWWYRPLIWLGLGCLVHCYWDSLSVGGLCWFYPITRYVDRPDGKHFKRYHKGWYRTGQKSETRVVIATVTVSLLFSFGALFFRLWEVGALELPF